MLYALRLLAIICVTTFVTALVFNLLIAFFVAATRAKHELMVP